MRLDALIKNRYPGLTRSQIEEAIHQGWVGGKSALRPSSQVEADAVLDFGRLEQHLLALQEGAEIEGIQVLFEGPDFLVIHKPQGVHSVPIRLNEPPTVTAWVRKNFPETNALFERVQPELAVHRLDIGTAGLLVVALTPKAHQVWRERFSQHEIEKEYVAWVWGIFPKRKQELQTEIHFPRGKSRVHIQENFPQGKFEAQDSPIRKTAIAQVEGLEIDTKRGISKVKITTSTGVRHQVRVQLSDFGFPLVGDAQYDPQYLERPIHSPHHWLWASSLSLGKEKWDDLPPDNWKPQ